MNRRHGFLPAMFTLLGALLALCAISQRVAAINNLRITRLPSSELLYEWTVLALLCAAVALLWQIRDRLKP